MTTAGTPEPLLRVGLDGRDRGRSRPVDQRVLTAHVLLCEATSDEPDQLPGSLRTELLGALGSRGRDAYRVIGGAQATLCPSAVVPDCSGPRWATEARDMVAEASVEQVEGELDARLGPDGRWRSRWERVREDPRSWLGVIGAGLLAAAPIIDRFCDRLDSRVDEERRRLDVVWGSTAELSHVLGGISDHMTTTADELHIAARCDVDVSVRGDLLVAPVIAPASVRMLVDRGDDLVAVYSLASRVGAGFRMTAGSAPDRLNALLGPARAAVLLTVNRPRTMGDLAVELNYAPSTVTHHVRRLVDAGLVVSQRSRKTVVVERTLAGHVLVDMLR